MDNIIFPNKEEEFNANKNSTVHIRAQQRKDKRYLTTIQGLTNTDLTILIKELRKKFSTGGAILTDEILGKVLQLNGDFRKAVGDYLINSGVCDKNNVQIHGF